MSHFRKTIPMKFIIPAAFVFLAACSIEKTEAPVVEAPVVEEVVVEVPAEEVVEPVEDVIVEVPGLAVIP
jgi:hypothetical protein